MKKKASQQKEPEGITGITVSGFKSISREQSIEIRPLTILAGANSSGKSSMMQPLLLLKQTLVVPYEPDGLLLGGSNIEFTSSDQILSRTGNDELAGFFRVGIRVGVNEISMTYSSKQSNRGLEIQKMTYNSMIKFFVYNTGQDFAQAKNAESLCIFSPRFESESAVNESNRGSILSLKAQIWCRIR